MATRREELEQEALDVGLVLHTYSPGDGVTRYRFFPVNAPANQNYFGPANGIYTALGLKDARLFIETMRVAQALTPGSPGVAV